MPQIKNLESLRNKVLETFERLTRGDVDIQEAAAVAKLSETVISGLKTEMQYAMMTNSVPHIPFLNNVKTEKELSLDSNTKKLLK